MKPKYQIGEDVLVRSETMPQINGDAVIKDIFFKGQAEGINGTRLSGPVTQLCYDIGIRNYIGQGMLSLILPWEHELRKKHKPSGKSFNEIMSDCGVKSTV
jgi:hypothetical protein